MTEKESGSNSRDDFRSELARLAREMRPTSSTVPTGGGAVTSLEGMDAAAQSVMVEQLRSETYKGSFPHPDVLQGLDACVSNGAERAFALTEREQLHRHKVDEKLVDAQISLVEAQVRRSDAESRHQLLLIILSFLFASFATAAAFIAVTRGHPAGVGILGGGALAFLAALLRLAKVVPPGQEKREE